jgi:predicted CXXCH cytochrome family protein
MSHLVRAAGLLIGLLIMFFFVRSFATTLSIEYIGLSAADNPRAWATRVVQHEPSTACAECHEETNKTWDGSAHVGVRCEDCHGLTKAHIEAARAGEDAPLVISNARDLCLTCHAKLDSRPEDFPQVDPLEHATDVGAAETNCASCHNPHDPGIPPELAHTLDGRDACLACHGPDEWKPLPPDHANRTEDICLNCHNLKEEGG